MSDETIASVTMLSLRCLGDGFCFFLMYSKSTRNFKRTFSLRRASNSIAGLSAVPSFARAQKIGSFDKKFGFRVFQKFNMS